MKPAFYANPMAIVLQSYRDILLNQKFPNFAYLAYAGLWAIGLMILGFAVCKHVDKRLMKEVVV